MTVLAVEGLRVAYPGGVEAVRDVSLAVGPGEALGLVGESGCGKSTLAGAVLGAVPGRGRVTGGRVLFEGRDVGALRGGALRAVRGGGIGLVSQDAASALNPAFTVGSQLVEVLRAHRRVGAGAAWAEAEAMLGEVGLPEPGRVMRSFPHRLSGGQQQRAVIAMALLPRPRLLLLDEPTTALDVTVEAGIIDLLRGLLASRGTAMLFITHNLGLVAQLCGRVAVMYAGEVVEAGPVGAVFRAPAHPYTRGLVGCIPRPDLARGVQALRPMAGVAGEVGEGCRFAPRCPHAREVCRGAVPLLATGEQVVRCVRWAELPAEGVAGGEAMAEGTAGETLLAVEGVSKTYRVRGGRGVRANRGLRFGVGRGRTLAIVGESGCGKSTFARTLMGLERPDAGSIRLGDEELAGRGVRRRGRGLLRSLQMVFQNPDETLNPSYAVARQVGRAVRMLDRSGEAAQARVRGLMEGVRLPEGVWGRRPGQLSGGQKQRVAVARAFAGQPALVVADEPVSALDVSVQAAVTRLLGEMQRAHGTALVVISHDLGFVRAVADEVVVMYAGEVVEAGAADAVFSPPYHPYTEALLSAAPGAGGRRVRLEGEVSKGEGAGCSFAGRCPRKLGAVCDRERPPERVAGDGHRILCHIPWEVLAAVPPVFEQEGAA